MKMRPTQRIGRERSKIYSGSKFTNWTRFNPYISEITALSQELKPTAIFNADDNDICRIFALDVHNDFIRPFGAEDILDSLTNVPKIYLRGLEGIYLLRGTKKQSKVSLSSLFRFGCYTNNRIYLHAFPKALLHVIFTKKTPRPDFIHEYKRAGAAIKTTVDGLEVIFNDKSVRDFFLSNVLMHEIGHHVDRFHTDTSKKRSENFADWFASEYGYRLKTSKFTPNKNEQR